LYQSSACSRLGNSSMTSRRGCQSPSFGSTLPSYFHGHSEMSRSCTHGDSALSRASCRHVGSDARHSPREVEPREETADDRFHADHRPPPAALRPPPSASRPTHRGRDRRHGPGSPSLDGAGLARPRRRRSWSVWMLPTSLSRSSDRRS
jgi:hypothetical protein